MPVKWGVVLLGMGLLSACASVPIGPSMLALPAVGKPMDVFQAEEDGCRAYAQQQTAAAAPPRQPRYDIAYMILTRKQPYQDLGAAYFDQRERHRVERRLVQRLERLGYEVALQPKALAS